MNKNVNENSVNVPVLELRNVTKHYKQGKNGLEVLKGVDFLLHTGEATALVGQSGSGKSTLLQIAGLLDKPSSGQIFIGGRDVSLAKDEQRTSIRRDFIGFVYQYHNLLGDFSALENVMMPMLIAGKSKNHARERATYLLEKMRLVHRIKHRPAELSGGEQQRVAIARALANEPKLLLADEPTGNLDPDTAEEVFCMLLKVINETGLSALIATHNMELAERLKRKVKLHNGRLEETTRNSFLSAVKNFY